MTSARTNLGATRERASLLRFEPTGILTATNVQEAITDAVIGGASRALPTISRQTVAGVINVALTDEVVALQYAVAGATTLNLPQIASRVPAGLPLWVFDFNGNAGDITLVPYGTDQIMGANANFIIGSGGAAQTGGSVVLIPSATLGGWLLR